MNKNKRSIALDVRTAAGLEVFWDLHATADVFVDGFAGNATDRLGIGYEDQLHRKPDIVYCQYTGFGRTGPYAENPDSRADDERRGRGGDPRDPRRRLGSHRREPRADVGDVDRWRRDCSGRHPCRPERGSRLVEA